jgi:signal transduction histidine kinase
VESPDVDVKVGERMEVAGFVDTTSGIAALSEAVTRRLGTAELPTAKLVTAGELMLPGMAGRVEPVVKMDHSGCLVRVRGLLRQIERRSSEGIWSMLIESDGVLFRAQMPGPFITPKPTWREGSEVAVTGVCELEFSPREPGTNSPLVSGFKLWLRNPDDVAIVKGPPWWTPQRLGVALGGTGMVLALALVWSLLLHRKVEQQMGIISSKLRSETIHTERNRLAQDLHDTLEQQLVGVALQLDDAEELIRKDPDLANEVVSLARRMLSHTRMEARRSVWDLRSQVLESEGLVPALEALARGVASPSGPSVVVRTDGADRSFPLETEFQLLRVAQEALANALKHARAKRIVISLERAGESTRLTIADDGEGFSAVALNRTDGSHFGVLGMYERAERIGGVLTIARNPDGGCSVALTLPHEPSPPLQSRHA